MDFDYTRNLLPPGEAAKKKGGFLSFFAIMVIAVSIIFLAFGVTVAFSQTSESVSGATSEVDVVTGAAAGAAINNYGQKPGKDARVYSEVATAPSLGGLALGGGHPCAYSKATAQISVIGSGAGFGGMTVDSACMLMVMGAAGDAKAYKAAQFMLAARDPDACAAMQAAGLVDCITPAERRAAKADAKKDWSKSTKSVAGWGAKCELTGKKLVFQATSAAARSAELSACKARYGL